MWTRAEHLHRCQTEGTFDVMVIGGGISGAGCALDLALRGFKVGLIEENDWGWGTSGRSTKLLHGGIRYLPQFDFRLIREGLSEQKVLAEIADFLYHPLRFVIPLYRQYRFADAPSWLARGRRARWALKSGLVTYDLLGGWSRPGGKHEFLSRSDVLDRVPKLRTEGLSGGYSYADAQTDDTRLVISLAKTAVKLGAVALGRARAEKIVRSGDRFVVKVTDTETGDSWEMTTRSVIVATGAYGGPDILDEPPPPAPLLSKGVHLLTTKANLGLSDHAVVFPETTDNRVLFGIPWLDYGMVGTTDTEYRGPVDRPPVDPEDIDYLLSHVHQYLEVDDFVPQASFAGLRALSDRKASSTARASRGHEIEEPSEGIVTILGGKLTAYRKIAAKASDRIARHLHTKVVSQTSKHPLVGAGRLPRPLQSRIKEMGLPTSLADRYGGETDRITEIVKSNPAGRRRLGDGSVVLAEVLYAINHEAATTLSDFGLRRTHLGWFSPPEQRRSDAVLIAAVFAQELNWSESHTEQQIANYLNQLSQPTDSAVNTTKPYSEATSP